MCDIYIFQTCGFEEKRQYNALLGQYSLTLQSPCRRLLNSPSKVFLNQKVEQFLLDGASALWSWRLTGFKSHIKGSCIPFEMASILRNIWHLTFENHIHCPASVEVILCLRFFMITFCVSESVQRSQGLLSRECDKNSQSEKEIF